MPDPTQPETGTPEAPAAPSAEFEAMVEQGAMHRATRHLLSSHIVWEELTEYDRRAHRDMVRLDLVSSGVLELLAGRDALRAERGLIVEELQRDREFLARRTFDLEVTVERLRGTLRLIGLGEASSPAGYAQIARAALAEGYENSPHPHEHVYRCQDCGDIGRGPAEPPFDPSKHMDQIPGFGEGTDG